MGGTAFGLHGALKRFTNTWVFGRTECVSDVGAILQDGFIGVETLGRLLLDPGKATLADYTPGASDSGYDPLGDLVLNREDAGGG